MFLFQIFALLFILFATDGGFSQQPESNEKKLNTTSEIPGAVSNETHTNKTNITLTRVNVTRKQFQIEEPNIIVKVYTVVELSIRAFLSNPKVKYVAHNIGICVVNGVMEIVTHFLPSPMIPLLASAAGMIIPFEPVVSLRERMPVTSYRRAFNSAMNSFMGTFDKYKVTERDDAEDPYMTRRFNRRFMNEPSKEKLRNREYI